MMNRVFKYTLSMVFCVLLVGCQSAYYSAMEKVGIHKRDIMVDRVEAAKDAQQDAQKQFKSALSQLSQLINFDGGELEKEYQLVKDQYDLSEQSAQRVSTKIAAIENVAKALFDEWGTEIGEYSSAKLKHQSELKLAQTKRKYQQLMIAMHNAEARMKPVLAALKDNTLYLKHNLNAQAIGALQGEYHNIKQNVTSLINDMNISIAQSQKFIDAMKN